MLPFKSQKCRLTSPYGYRTHPIHGWRHFHGGIDLVGNDDEVVAVQSGTVVRSRIVKDKNDATWQWGEYIAIQGTDGKTIYYCHLAKRLVSAGAYVKKGDVIGIQGATGQVTGKHLHFECRKGSTQINAADYIGIPNKVGTCNGKPIDNVSKSTYSVGDKYTIKSGDKYSNGLSVPQRLVGQKFTIMQTKTDRILLGEISSWVKT